MTQRRTARLGWLTVVLILAFAATAGAEKLERREKVMSMPVTVTVWASDAAAGERALNLAFDEFKRIEGVFSAYRQGSEVSRINQNAGRSPVRVSGEMIRTLQWARRISELTRGGFDVTVASYAWEYGFGQGDYRVPTQARLDQVKKLVNYKYVMLYPEENTVLFKRDGVQIDLGGIAKSHALNTVRQTLRRAKVQAALINAGGDVTVVGSKPGGGPWQVGVRHPRDPNRMLAVVPLAAGKILSSGDYERFFIKEEARYHHIFNPATGKPENLSLAATLSLPEKPSVDLPSVALMLLPPDQAVKLVESIPGAECLIVDKDKKVWLSRGWKNTVKTAW